MYDSKERASSTLRALRLEIMAQNEKDETQIRQLVAMLAPLTHLGWWQWAKLANRRKLRGYVKFLSNEISSAKERLSRCSEAIDALHTGDPTKAIEFMQSELARIQKDRDKLKSKFVLNVDDISSAIDGATTSDSYKALISELSADKTSLLTLVV